MSPRNSAVYGLWEDDTLIAIGTMSALRGKLRGEGGKSRHMRLLTPEGGRRQPNKWRDIAAAALRDLEGYNYEEIADLLHITVGMAQGAVSRVRCGRYQ